MEELWEDIRGYEGLYQISAKGRVKSLARLIKNGKNTVKISKEHIKKPHVNTLRHGYCSVMLYKNNVGRRYLISRLVAQAFLPNPDNKPEVNHINGDKLNNSAENLEWATSKENKTHAWKNKLCTANHKMRKIICNETNETFESVAACAKNLNLDRRTIFRVLNGERKSYKKLTFSYI